MQQWRSNERGKYIVCVDSYEDSVMKGRILNPLTGAEAFCGLVQFLLKMEDALECEQAPQSFTELRRFAGMLQPEKRERVCLSERGMKMTFELKVIFRQHSSWQGTLVCREKKAMHHFRSVLELIVLMDSALRSVERSGCA